MIKRNDSFLISPPPDFTIEVFRLEEIDKSMFRDYHRYNFHQVVWFTGVDGDQRYEIDFREFLIAPGQVVVIYPRQIEKLDITGKSGFLFTVHNDTFFSINRRIGSGYLNGYLDIQTFWRQKVKRQDKDYYSYLICSC